MFNFLWIVLPCIILIPLLWISLSRFNFRRRVLNPMDMDVSNGQLVFLSVTSRPLEGDKNHEAWCTFKALITGPDIEPTEIISRVAIFMDSLWPVEGQGLPVIYLREDVKKTWQFVDTDELGVGMYGS